MTATTTTSEFKRRRALATSGDAVAQHNLGVMYQLGTGVEQNSQEAVKWHRLAAEEGLADAQCNLAELFRSGDGVEKDISESLRFYRLAAKQGLDRAKNYCLSRFDSITAREASRARERSKLEETVALGSASEVEALLKANWETRTELLKVFFSVAKRKERMLAPSFNMKNLLL